MTTATITRRSRARERRTVENPAYAAFVRRIVQAYGRRAAGDIEALRSLVELAVEVDAAARFAVVALRGQRHPYSWAEIASRLGVTKQAAAIRYTDRPATAEQPEPSAAYLESLLDLLDGEVTP